MEAVHRSGDSRSRGIRRTAGAVTAALLISLIPALASAQSGEPLPADLQGFPTWLRVTHFVNFLFMTQIIRAGLQILFDHPRLYWNVDCTPDSELALLTGAAMSPAMAARFPWYPRLFGNRQVARSIHFLVLCAFLAFVAIHVTMVALTGLTRNMNHIVLGTDDTSAMGLWIGLIGVGIVIAVNIAANVVSRRAPRLVQHVSKYTVTPGMGLVFDRMKPRAEYSREQISPYFWPNGKLPVSDDWKGLAADGFDGYRLHVYSLVENPVELSLEEIRALGVENQLGFKQVKWIRAIEFVESRRSVFKGEGGYNEDNEFYGCKADI
jgi:hypothetical protein